MDKVPYPVANRTDATKSHQCIMFYGSPFVNYSVYNEPKVVIMHRCNQIEQNRIWHYLTVANFDTDVRSSGRVRSAAVYRSARPDFRIRILRVQIPIQMGLLVLFSMTTHPGQSKDWGYFSLKSKLSTNVWMLTEKDVLPIIFRWKCPKQWEITTRKPCWLQPTFIIGTKLLLLMLTINTSKFLLLLRKNILLAA